MNTSEKPEAALMKSAQANIDFFLWECPAEEYDAERVKVLIALKRAFTPITESPIHIAYHNTKQLQQIIYISHTTPVRKKASVVLGIAIAACIASIILIGNSNHVRALPDTGFFLFLRKDKEGIFAITSPSYTDRDDICTNCSCCVDCECECREDLPEDK